MSTTWINACATDGHDFIWIGQFSSPPPDQSTGMSVWWDRFYCRRCLHREDVAAYRRITR